MNLMSNEIHSRIKLSSPRRSSRQLHFSEFFSGGGETRPELEISNYENDQSHPNRVLPTKMIVGGVASTRQELIRS
jgi:hypothetical protein